MPRYSAPIFDLSPQSPASDEAAPDTTPDRATPDRATPNRGTLYVPPLSEEQKKLKHLITTGNDSRQATIEALDQVTTELKTLEAKLARSNEQIQAHESKHEDDDVSAMKRHQESKLLPHLGKIKKKLATLANKLKTIDDNLARYQEQQQKILADIEEKKSELERKQAEEQIIRERQLAEKTEKLKALLKEHQSELTPEEIKTNNLTFVRDAVTGLKRLVIQAYEDLVGQFNIVIDDEFLNKLILKLEQGFTMKYVMTKIMTHQQIFVQAKAAVMRVESSLADFLIGQKPLTFLNLCFAVFHWSKAVSSRLDANGDTEDLCVFYEGFLLALVHPIKNRQAEEDQIKILCNSADSKCPSVAQSNTKASSASLESDYPQLTQDASPVPEAQPALADAKNPTALSSLETGPRKPNMWARGPPKVMPVTSSSPSPSPSASNTKPFTGWANDASEEEQEEEEDQEEEPEEEEEQE